MFEEDGLICNPQNNARDGFYESFTIRSKTMQVLRSLEASERKIQEALRLQQEQRNHDREWEATQEENSRVWQAEQDTIRRKREDDRDKEKAEREDKRDRENKEWQEGQNKIKRWIGVAAIVFSLIGVVLGKVLFTSPPPPVAIQLPADSKNDPAPK